MRRKGFSLVELLVGMGMMSFVLFGLLSLLVFGLRSYQRTTVDVENTNKTAQTMRRVTETIRAAVDVSVSADGKKLTYYMPKVAGVDAITGESEYQIPIVSDGTARLFEVTGGNLIDRSTNRILVKNVASKDPDPTSSQYNQVYDPFTVTTIGSRRAITINIIAQQGVRGEPRYVRMKTTVLIRNAK
ncbi:MAG: prepilin-type N-terminal cleavage/methylation domain-containing protein [Fimbriimonadaceae bacterium]|nr:prepilin-type N-terminal cleavage/methylation domain-containing protein [Fimbriimonadaceae bacterium]